jgi:hypothetical protein
MRPRPSRRRRAAGAAVLLLAALAGPAVGPAAAQEASLRLAAGVADPVRVSLRELPGAALDLDLALAAGDDPGAAVALRRRSAAGVLGTLVLEGEAALRLADPVAGRGTVRARGALGPVALRLQADVWGAPPERFDPTADPGDAPFARGAALRLAGDGRPSRGWLVGGDLAVARAGDGALAWDLAARARGRRLLGREVDLALAAAGRLGPGPDGGAALGAGVVWAPRRAPDVAVRAWLDVRAEDGAVAWRPGAESAGALRAAGGRLAWTLRARPAGLERAPWWAELAWRRPLGGMRLELRATGRAGGAAGAGWSLSASARVPLRDDPGATGP